MNYPQINIIFVYISEAHAVDVWPIGKSAGVLNYKHNTIEDRSKCANNFIESFNFNESNTINTYLDNMDNSLQNELSAWPFRYYIISFDNESNDYKFKYIPDPSDSEFNISELINII